MKTIEERAKEYASKKAGISLSAVYNEALARIYEEAYVAGAKEQQAIDEEVRLKKCDDMSEAEYNRETAFVSWYLENGRSTPTYSDAIEWARKKLLEEACEWLKENIEGGVHPQSVYGFVDKFRKAMEE
ncbi:MAG: hypothetical protein SPF70_08150 [Lachnospiraceae bacterium]|nr:hypothetical protein [Lachnospiraceae bacterium]